MLEVSGLQSGYGPSQVLFDVSLDVRPGEVGALLGRNGMGKTTTVSTLMGLVRAWGLPELLIRLLDDNPNHDPRVRTIELAARIARHSARGWDDAGLPDDFTELAALLRCDRSLLLQRLHVPEAFHAALGGSARG